MEGNLIGNNMANLSSLIHEAPPEEEAEEADDNEPDEEDEEELLHAAEEEDEYSSDNQSAASQNELLDEVPENELESYVRNATTDNFKQRAKTAPLRPMEHVEQFKMTPTFTNLE